MVRTDSAFYSAGVRRRRPRGRGVLLGYRADEHLGQGGDRRHRPRAWTPIAYRRAIWDDQLRCWVCAAEVAEVAIYRVHLKERGRALTARLIVRRVKDLNRNAGDGQDELFPAWRYHAVFTDSPFEMIQAEEHHRDHAIIEQVFADWTDGPLAHLPSVL